MGDFVDFKREFRYNHSTKGKGEHRMAKTLVLAEKPSVGKELARVLGCKRGAEGYMESERHIVTWALGHLVTLADPDVYDKKLEKWDMEDLPMLPQTMKLVVIRETTKQYKIVQGLMKRGDVSELVIATDAGREGELVARWIMMKAGWNKPTKRLWISSQTDRAIKEGFSNLRPAREYDNLFRSAQARAHADWLVGLNVTRALTCKFNAQLSAGRVQTPTLALIVTREEEIKRFQPKEYYGAAVYFDGFSATYKDSNGQAHSFDRGQMEAVAQQSRGLQGTITQAIRMKRQTPPPAAYDLTELQRDANKKYAYSAKETLNIMQSLYERHKVLTYPRTDSRYISDDVVATLPDRLRAVMVSPYKELAQKVIRSRPLQTKYIVNNSKVTDHHAIIPTEEPPQLYDMTGPERNIYDLVVRRFLAVLMPPTEYEEVKLTIKVGKHSFTAKGKHIIEQGWKSAYDKNWQTDEEAEEAHDDQRLPALQEGMKLPIRSAKVTTGKTKPPARYTEATLLTAMEHPQGQVTDKKLNQILQQTSGLGTPATRADIIEKLFSAFYVERRGKELVPTSKGIQLIKLVPKDLRSAAMTAIWEDRLGKIAKGTETDTAFVGEMRSYATKLVAAVKASDAKYSHDNQTRKPCPECGKLLLLVHGKRGDMLICPDRECGFRKSVMQTTNARCPNCHKKLELWGEGDKQTFSCACGYREKLSDFFARRKADGAGKSDVRRYMAEQKAKQEPANTAMAEALAKWMKRNEEK